MGFRTIVPIERCPRRGPARHRGLVGRPRLPHRALSAPARRAVQHRGGVPKVGPFRARRRGGVPRRARAHLPRRASDDEGAVGDARSEPAAGGRRPRPDPALAQGSRGAARRCRTSDPAVARPGRLHGDRGRPLPRRLRSCLGRRLRDRLRAVRRCAFGANRAGDARVPLPLGRLPRRRHCPSGLLADARRALRAGRRSSASPGSTTESRRRPPPSARRNARRPANSRFYWGASESAVAADARATP